VTYEENNLLPWTSEVFFQERANSRFFQGSVKIFPGRKQKVVKFDFPHSKLRKQPFLLNIQKFQNAEGVKVQTPTPMRITIISNISCYEHTRFQGQIISFHFVKQVQVHSMLTA